MLTVALYDCDGCGTPIYPFRGEIFTCPYCGEQYKHDDLHTGRFIRITTTPLPRTSEVQTEDGIKTLTLYEVREQFARAEMALDVTIKAYKKACRIYEAARPPKPQ